MNMNMNMVRMIQSEMLGAHPLLCACLDRVGYILPVQPTPGRQNQRKLKLKLKLAGHETQGRVSSEGSDAGPSRSRSALVHGVVWYVSGVLGHQSGLHQEVPGTCCTELEKYSR